MSDTKNAPLDVTSVGFGVFNQAVGTSAAALSAFDCRTCYLRSSTAAPVYIGATSAVTSITGFAVESLPFELPVYNTGLIYVTASAANSIEVLYRD